MRNLTVKILAVLGLALATTAAVQAAPATASASAAAEIIAPIALLNVDGTGLVFGQIVPQGGGTVTIAPDSTRTSTGVEVVPSSAKNAAHFKVTGNAGNTFSIALPSTTTISSGSDSMTVDAFTSDPSGTGTLSAIGEQAINVGGTLHVDANQPVGHYTGTFSITVAYN